MRIYFTADSQAEEKLQQAYSLITETFHQAGALVMSNLAEKNLAAFSSQDLEKIDQSGEGLLEKMDALVIEGSRPIPESGYLIALALAHQKPILYLCEKGRQISQNLVHLQKDKSAAKFLTLQYYGDTNLEKIILEFLQAVESGEGKELPTIKFTLRVTSRIERYLHWKTHNTKITKADFLRHLIEGLIDQDSEYLKFIKKNERKS